MGFFHYAQLSHPLVVVLLNIQSKEELWKCQKFILYVVMFSLTLIKLLPYRAYVKHGDHSQQ